MIAALVMANLSSGCSEMHPVASPEGAAPVALVADPATLGMGRLAAGESSRSALMLKNPTGRVIDLASFETSCPCVTIGPTAARLMPGGSTTLAVSFEPREEPDFRGMLSVSYTGRDAKGGELVKGIVTLDVQGAAPARGGE